ncbi:hypothetical protein FKW77_007502 [Venturia effusa]|uniref:Uncharacterized protein n=1 Tax=Venturia effusa TaxID=50376 RepID=A0A517KWT6_9PEZI|nr:hypothetical protein FKW77_007502 [Venturia effusa]
MPTLILPRSLFTTRSTKMGTMGFTFKRGHCDAAYEVFEHPASGKTSEFPALITTPQQDVDAVQQRTKIHPITDKRAQPWFQLIRANLHNYDVTTLPSLEATQQDVREFLFFVLGCDRFGTVAEDESSATIQFIQTFPHGGQALRQFEKMEDWMVDVPYTWTDIYKEKHYISESVRKQIAKHCFKAITPLIKAENNAQKIKEKKTHLVETLKMALCFGKKAKNTETPPPVYVEKERFSIDS